MIIDDARGVELSHWCLSSNYTWDVEAQLFNTFLEVDEDDIGEHLETVPASIDDNLAAVPHLTRMAHSWLRQLMLVHFWLRPSLFLYTHQSINFILTGIKNEDVIYYAFFAIALSSSEDNEILTELSRRVAVPGGWRLTLWTIGVDLDTKD